MNSVIENIRKIRDVKKLSQYQIAEKMNISQAQYARFELGKTKTDLKTIMTFADVVGMSLIDVLTYPEKYINIREIGQYNSSESKVFIQIELKDEKKESALKMIDSELINKI